MPCKDYNSSPQKSWCNELILQRMDFKTKIITREEDNNISEILLFQICMKCIIAWLNS